MMTEPPGQQPAGEMISSASRWSRTVVDQFRGDGDDDGDDRGRKMMNRVGMVTP